jgi:HPt (histidine-containing phosphotransfer) domain-containing protein
MAPRERVMTTAGGKLAAKARPHGGAGIGASDLVLEEDHLILDEDHLARMTLGDQALEREVLEIFVRQNALMLGRIADAGPARVAEAAHTLSGSARGIGAWRVARAAERLERASGESCQQGLTHALADLEAASLEACAAIAAHLSDMAY